MSKMCPSQEDGHMLANARSILSKEAMLAYVTILRKLPFTSFSSVPNGREMPILATVRYNDCKSRASTLTLPSV